MSGVMSSVLTTVGTATATHSLMVGYAACFCCHRPFFFNPLRVPSYKGEPICRGCIDIVNRRRAAAGLPLWPVAADAYEPIDEGEL